MKIVINYDLLEKINSANGHLNLQRIMLNELKAQALFIGIFTGIDMISPTKDGIHWGANLAACSTWFALRAIMTVMVEHKFKDRIELLAYMELAKLSLKLNDLNVKTSPDLLKKSELSTTEYKFVNENFRPIIQQNKYILVPTYDGLGGIKDTSILQEHEIGSKQYVLSIGSPSRIFKLAYARG
ncbi:MAG: hypothetical protein ACM3O4_02320 [Ignavibacteriales bacterium]